MFRNEGIFEWRGERAKLMLAVLFGLLPLAALGCGETANEIRAKMDEERARGAQPASISPREQTPEVSVATVSLETSVEETTGSVTPNREVSFGEAEAIYRDRRYDEAVVLFSAYTNSRPENAWGHYMLGLSQWKAGLLLDAERSFGEALDIDPTHVKSLINLTRVLLEQERPDDAIETAGRAVELDPGSSDAVRQLARAYHDLGQVDEAIESYRDAIVLDDEDAWSMNNLGYVLIQEDRFQEAIRSLARATGLRQDVPLFFNNLGMALERSGHVLAAREAYLQAVQLDGTHGKARSNLERVESIKGAADTGIDLVQLALEFTWEIDRLRTGGDESSLDAEQPGAEGAKPEVQPEPQPDEEAVPPVQLRDSTMPR